jgi:small subunit ribosomal protein S2
VIPGNDDAGRAIALYCDLMARAAIDGISRSQGAAGMDLGEAEAPTLEPALEVASADAVVEGPAEVFELLAAPRGAPDDLAKLQGVGPQLVKKLNDGGVFHYWQIAALTAGEAEKLDGDLKLSGRILRDNWIEQARGLAAG